MAEPVLHIVIIWSEGADRKEDIIADISTSFSLRNNFTVSWSSDNFYENLKRFYAHSLQDKSPKELAAILTHKMEHCGTAPFTLLIFEDKQPTFENRLTSNGMTMVNANVFDKKATYRKWLGGGHKIHASDSVYETNKDIALLFGYTTTEFLNRFPVSEEATPYHNNCVGVPTFQSIEELFFVLNQTISYVVLRNFEGLPNDYFVDDHGDIDLLVENINFMVYLTGAINKFPEDKNRVYHTISIQNEEVPFDFRHVGDGYYDTKWELHILNKRGKHPNGFYIPAQKAYFYSLLYHAYIQKRKISPDYKLKLQHIAENIGVSYTAGQDEATTHELLHSYMQANGYAYSLPKDGTVYFNKKFVDQRNGQPTVKDRKLVTATVSRTDSESFFTEVFETPTGFLKIANHPVVTNEIEFLNALKDSVYTPNIIKTEIREHDAEVLLEKIDGFALTDITQRPDFWKCKTVQQFTWHLLQLLIELLAQDIVHRDIRPANILVVQTDGGYEPRLIDFGWSMYHGKRDEAVTPKGLGHTYAYRGNGFSDAYSLGKCIQYIGKNLTFLDTVIKNLGTITPEAYTNKEALKKQLVSLQQKLENNSAKPSKRDTIALLVKRYRVHDRLEKLVGEANVKRLKKHVR